MSDSSDSDSDSIPSECYSDSNSHWFDYEIKPASAETPRTQTALSQCSLKVHRGPSWSDAVGDVAEHNGLEHVVVELREPSADADDKDNPGALLASCFGRAVLWKDVWNFFIARGDMIDLQDLVEEESQELQILCELFTPTGQLKPENSGGHQLLVWDSVNTAKFALLQWVYVGKQNRGMGIGRLVLRKLIETLRTEYGVTQL